MEWVFLKIVIGYAISVLAMFGVNREFTVWRNAWQKPGLISELNYQPQSLS